MRSRLLVASLTLIAGCGPGNGNCAGKLCLPGPRDLAIPVVADMAAPSGDLAQGSTDLAPPRLIGNQVDVLFMIDNSPSMDAMQTMLKQHFGDFLTPLEGLSTPLDLQIGVVTSDYGAGNVPNLAGGCDKSPGGQRGLLQAVAAAGTPEAQAGCMGPVGKPFLHYTVDGAGHVTANTPGGATDATTLANTFTCMASVGTSGCGFEHQLESVYAALKNQTENAGFLRPQALLVVVFVTNEDDSSAPPTTDVFNPDPAKAAPPPMGYGALDTYRQTHFGVACSQAGMLALTPYGDSGGALQGCEGAPNSNSVMLGSEYDVSRYINLFTLPASQGGVKVEPLNVILAAIDAPESPVTIRQVAANTGRGTGTFPNPAAYQPCPAPNLVDGKSCLVRLDHSCQNTIQPGFFGDPAVRLNRVVRSVVASQVTSICGENLTTPPDYAPAMKSLAALIKARLH